MSTQPFVANLAISIISLNCEFVPIIRVKCVFIFVSDPVIINNPCARSFISGLNVTTLLEESVVKSLYDKLSTLNLYKSL